ncbi:MAG: hypothetical protein J6M34_07120 [Clostridia bacterium]|nr:hypothetical protein [Clostridia bacterium]
MKRLWIQNLCMIAVFLVAFFLIVAIGIEEGKKSRSVQETGIVLRDKKPGTEQSEQTERPNQPPHLSLTEDSIVYITATGAKYHLWADCSALKQAKAIIATRLEDAAKEGRALCSFCNKRQNPQSE